MLPDGGLVHTSTQQLINDKLASPPTATDNENTHGDGDFALNEPQVFAVTLGFEMQGTSV